MFTNCPNNNNSEFGIKYHWGPSGNCPVQAEGTINGNFFSFRARGTQWALELYEDGKLGNTLYCSYGEHLHKWPEAGWITEEEARKFIEKGAKVIMYAKDL